MEVELKILAAQGMVKTMQTQIHLTVIQCQKLRNRVGEGTISPYQVTIAQGDLLGSMGHVTNQENRPASNQDSWAPTIIPKQSLVQRLRSCFH